MRTKNTTTSKRTTALFDRIANTAGRFFGVTLQSGERINAQYRSQSERYLVVYDRNQARNRRLLKTNVSAATV
jgi:hypothetical protein